MWKAPCSLCSKYTQGNKKIDIFKAAVKGEGLKASKRRMRLLFILISSILAKKGKSHLMESMENFFNGGT